MNTIELDEKGIFCYEAPEKPEYCLRILSTPERHEIVSTSCAYKKCECLTKYDTYHEALEQAKRDRRYFKPEESEFVKLLLITSDNHFIEQGKPYPVPEGYEVKIEKKYQQVEGTNHPYAVVQYAILAPKEKGAGNAYPVIEPVKQSIEEIKWCDSCGKRTTWVNCECENYIKEQENKVDQKQHLIAMMKQDEEAGMYGAGDDYPVIEQSTSTNEHSHQLISTAKQQSIEKTAGDYADSKYRSMTKGLEWIAARKGYIVGAKSQAAKIEKLQAFKDSITKIVEDELAQSCTHIRIKKIVELLEQFKQEKT